MGLTETNLYEKNKETKKSLKVQFKTPPKKNDKAKAKSTNSRNRLGMGLSSLMSKDQELASVIRSKVKVRQHLRP